VLAQLPYGLLWPRAQHAYRLHIQRREHVGDAEVCTGQAGLSRRLAPLGAGVPRLVPGLILRAFYPRFGRVSVQLHNDCEPCQVPTKKPRPEPGPRYQCGIAWLTVGGPTLRQQRRG
jgi:hypothetical protein